MSQTITLNKTIQTPLFALQTLATTSSTPPGGRIASSVVDVSTKGAALVTCHIGRTVTTAFTASTSVDVLIQASAKATGDDEWFDLCAFSTGAAAVGNTNALTSSGGASGTGSSATALTLSANAAVDYSLAKDLIYFKNSTVANGEFHRAIYASTGGTALIIADDLARVQNSDNLYNGNFEFKAALDLSGVTRLRAIVLNNSGVSVDLEAFLTTLDSATSA